jgi:hypothetical protein
LVDGKSIYDRLRAPKFHLLTFSDGERVGEKPSVSAGVVSGRGEGLVAGEGVLSETESKYARLIDRHVVPLYPNVVEIFGIDKPFKMLLRPDNYIGFISSDTSLRSLSNYFGHLFNH